MSVLVKSMTMPSVCAECWLFHKGYCSASIGEPKCDVDIQNAKTDWCPLVEVPTPHGKLIDANAHKETLDYYIREAGWSQEINTALGWVKDDFIDAEPAVIEAEE